MDGRLIVAYGLDGGWSEDLPLIPDSLVLRQRDRFWLLTRSGETDMGGVWYACTLEDGGIREVAGKVLWQPGSWAILEAAGLALFPSGDEERVRRERALELVRGTSSMTGQPEAVLSTLRAAGALMRVPVDRLVRRLESVRLPNESMADAYLRLRRSGKA